MCGAILEQGMKLRGCLVRERQNQSALTRIFYGRGGMRAGWRVAIFIALFALQTAAIVAAFVLYLRHTGHHGKITVTRFTPALVTANEMLLLLPALGASWAMAVLEDTSMAAYGLQGARKFLRLTGGLAGGVATMSVVALILVVTAYGTAAPGQLSLAGDLRYGAEWLAVSLLIAFTEEFLMRGYLLQALGRGMGFWPAALLTSLMFGAVHGHNAGETPIGLFQIIIAGLVLCLGIWFTRSLWWSIGFHGGWDYAENYIFGTRDSGTRCFGTLMEFSPHGNVYFSGGLTGPEGSVFGLGVLILAGAVVWLVFSSQNRRVTGLR
jgi:uncharacterized protein